MSDCPLEDVRVFNPLEPQYCPGCGGDVRTETNMAGHAVCEACDRGFWVET